MFIETGCPHCDCQYFDEGIDIYTEVPIMICQNCGQVFNVSDCEWEGYSNEI